MEIEADFVPLSPSPVHGMKLKRLKKARDLENPQPKASTSDSGILDSDESIPPNFEEPIVGSESVEESNGLDFHPKEVKGVDESETCAKKHLEFDSAAEEFEGDREGEGPSENMDTGKKIGDLEAMEPEKKKREMDDSSDKKEKKKRRVGSVDADGKSKESSSNKRRAEKDRRDYLNQLRSESQRLLRETRNVGFKLMPLVQKPISSVLVKIRQRKLEVSKKSTALKNTCIGDDHNNLREDNVDGSSGCALIEGKVNNEVERVGSEVMDTDLQRNDLTSPLGLQAEVHESRQAFRAPVEDTQELFSYTQTIDAQDEQPNEELDGPVKDPFTTSVLAMNLRLDSAPPDDVCSSDEEENDKENIDPCPIGSADGSSSPCGDPVRAFVDEEAVEDDSDNELLNLSDSEEDEDLDDAIELNEMIAHDYKEKPIDNERRNQFHQRWLEEQDASGTDNLLKKLKCGSELSKEAVFDEDEEDEEHQDMFGDEPEEDTVPPSYAQLNLKKVKQMIPQMFTDEDDKYVSDEELEERRAKQCLFPRSEQFTFLSPAEDESSREVFGLIKKLNIVTDTKKKGKTPACLDKPCIGQNSKSSFLRRGSNHFLPSSHKQNGSGRVRSFIFGRDDSNSRTSISEDSSDAVQRENQPEKTVTAKFKSNFYSKSTPLNSASQESGTSLLEVLRRSSVNSSQCIRETTVRQTESVFAAFKLTKKPIKTEGRI